MPAARSRRSATTSCSRSRPRSPRPTPGSRRASPRDLLDALVAEVPAEWLEGENPQVYVDYLAARLEEPRAFVAEAEAARG